MPDFAAFSVVADIKRVHLEKGANERPLLSFPSPCFLPLP